MKTNMAFCAISLFIIAIFMNQGSIVDDSSYDSHANGIFNLSCTLKASRGQCRVKLENQGRSCLIFYLLLLQAGDIEANPGPPKYPCGICNKNVGWNSKSIQCDGCNIWFHAKCAKIGPGTFRAAPGGTVYHQ